MRATVPIGQREGGGPQGPVLQSVPPARLSGLVMPVLFFRRCFLRLAWGDGGGSSLGLVAPAPPPVVALGPPALASPVPLAERRQTKNTRRCEVPLDVHNHHDGRGVCVGFSWCRVCEGCVYVCVCVCVSVCVRVCVWCVRVRWL